MKIRFAVMKDLDDLVMINVGDEKGYSHMNRRMLRTKVTEKQVLAAISDGRISGLLYFVPEFLGRENIWYLEQVTVDKSYRRKGIGKALITDFIKYAKSRQISKVFADVRLPNNASLRTCISCGGKVAGSVRGLSKDKKDKRTIVRFDL